MKIFRIIVFVSIIVTMLVSTVYAAIPEDDTPLIQSGAQPRTEEVQWYYKKIDGITYMRLWSITYGYWKTNWIPMSE